MKRANEDDDERLNTPTMTVYSRGFKGPCGFVVHAPTAQKPKSRAASKPKKAAPRRR